MLQAITLYLKHKQTYRSRAPQSYAKTLERLYGYNKNNPKTLGVGEIVGFCEYLKEELPKVARPGKDWHTSYSYSLTVFKDFLKFVGNKLYDKVRPEKARHNAYPPLIREQFDLISDYLETEPDNFANIQRLLIHRMLFETGVRVSELLNLKWPSLNKSKPEAFIQNCKNMDGRWIFWSSQTHELLLKFIEQRKQYRGDWLFCTYEGEMSIRCVQRMLENLGKILGITPLHPHMYRHGFAHERFNKGADIELVRRALGHKSLESTQHYLVLSQVEMGRNLQKYLT